MLRAAGYSESVVRVPRANGLDSRAFAATLAREATLTPRDARMLGLDVLQSFALDEEAHPQVRTVAARELVQYGLNAPDDLDSAASTQTHARTWLRSRMLDVLRLGMRFALAHPMLAARMLAQSPKPTREAPKAPDDDVMSPSAKI